MHDEKKIEEIIIEEIIIEDKRPFGFDADKDQIRFAMQEYAEHIRKQTIEEYEKIQLEFEDVLMYMKKGIETSMEQKAEPREITYAKGQVSGIQAILDKLQALNELE